MVVEDTACGRKVFQVLCLLVMLFQKARTWLLYFLVWQIHSKGAVGRKHLILSFFFRRESRSLKMEIIKQTYLAANIKEELRELKRNKQHNANLRTQILVHDSFNIVETTPTSSLSSISWDVSFPGIEEKKCNWCQIPFNCFETRKKRLKHISNCKKSVSQSFEYNSTNGTFFLKFVSERCVLKSAK